MSAKMVRPDESTAAPASEGKDTNNEKDPNRTIIVVGDDNKLYMLTKDKWQVPGNLLTDPAGQGLVGQLERFGTYLAFVPPEIAIGIGEICTVVNLKAILKNNVDPKTEAIKVE